MTVLPRDHEWTVADLELLPDDGLRYELVDGMLLVSPAPRLAHQRAQLALCQLLYPLVPAGFELLMAPVDYQPTTRRSLQPDLLIFPRAEADAAVVTTPLLLAVEIVSPSSRSVDLLLKRGLYEEAGVSHYWVLDPDSRKIITWSLVDGTYGEPRVCEDGQPLALTEPLAVALTTEAIFG
jgi:Uma2 family endonuclease